MFISPIYALDQGWLTCGNPLVNLNVHVQPNAIDIDCTRLFAIDTSSNCALLKDSKQMCTLTEVQTNPETNQWRLQRGQFYDFMSSFSVDLPAGVACYLIARSTLVRNAISVTSGLYDSGYKGPVGGVIGVNGGSAGEFQLEVGTRVCQLIFVKSDDTGILYAGGYNTAADQHWSDKSIH